MKILRIIAVFIGIFLLSAFLAPWIYALTGFKFERILSRLIMVFSLAAILFFIRHHWRDLFKQGLTWDRLGSFPLLSRGFLIGFMTLGLLTATEVALGGRSYIPNWDGAFEVSLKMLQYFLVSLLVGFIEETFFRGFLYSKIRGRLPVWGSLLAVNSFYAVLHFFKGGGIPIPAQPTVADSFRILLHLVDPLKNPAELAPTFFGLLFFGGILSYCYLKTGSLYFSIGLHAGCVFFLKVDGWFIQSVPQASALIFGDKNLYSGVIGFCFFAVLFLFLTRFLSSSGNKSAV